MTTYNPVFRCLALLAVLPSMCSAGTFKFVPVSENSLGLWDGDQPVFVYNHGRMEKTGVPKDRARSTYLHPVYGLDGEVLTDDFPADHHHHRGLFWAWPHVKSGGKEYDLWMLKGVEQRFEKWIQREGGEQAVLSVQNGWYVGDNKIVQEVVTFKVHALEDQARAIDLELLLVPLGQPLTLVGAEGKSYGGLTLRFAPREDTVITTPLGDGKDDLPMTKLPWADLTAKFPSTAAPSGAAIFVHPSHPDYPPMWLTRHYGVLCLGWPGVEEQSFEPGQTIRLKYRVWIHRGAVGAERLAGAYKKYTETERLK